MDGADVLGRWCAVADTYAAALLPLAQRQGSARAVLEELEAAALLLEQVEDFALWAAWPGLPVERKLAVLEQAFGGRMSGLACDALLVICRHGRLGLLGQILAALRRRVEQAEGLVRVRVTAAAEPSPAERAALEAVLARRLGAKPVLEVRLDPSILGGLVVVAGDRRIDVSVRAQLEQLKTAVRRRVAEHIAAAAAPEG